MKEQFTGVEQEKRERTCKSEIKTNVEFWKNLALENAEVNEDEIRAVIEGLPEKEGFDWYLAIPKGVKFSEILKKMGERYPIFSSKDIVPDDIKMPRTAQETYAVAARYNQEPDEDSLRKMSRSTADWEATGKTYMSPLERVVADMRWHSENGTHLDEQYRTMCPGSRTASGNVPTLRYGLQNNTEGIMSFDPEETSAALGVREVITKDPEV